MTRQVSRRRADTEKKPAAMSSREQIRVIAGVRRQIEDLYFQLDSQLTRMAEIQLQFDGLRSKIRHL